MTIIILFYNDCTLKVPIYMLLLVLVSFFLKLFIINKNKIV